MSNAKELQILRRNANGNGFEVFPVPSAPNKNLRFDQNGNLVADKDVPVDSDYGIPEEMVTNPVAGQLYIDKNTGLLWRYSANNFWVCDSQAAELAVVYSTGYAFAQYNLSSQPFTLLQTSLDGSYYAVAPRSIAIVSVALNDEFATPYGYCGLDQTFYYLNSLAISDYTVSLLISAVQPSLSNVQVTSLAALDTLSLTPGTLPAATYINFAAPAPTLGIDDLINQVALAATGGNGTLDLSLYVDTVTSASAAARADLLAREWTLILPS